MQKFDGDPEWWLLVLDICGEVLGRQDIWISRSCFFANCFQDWIRSWYCILYIYCSFSKLDSSHLCCRSQIWMNLIIFHQLLNSYVGPLGWIPLLNYNLTTPYVKAWSLKNIYIYHGAFLSGILVPMHATRNYIIELKKLHVEFISVQKTSHWSHSPDLSI